MSGVKTSIHQHGPHFTGLEVEGCEAEKDRSEHRRDGNLIIKMSLTKALKCGSVVPRK